MPSRPAPIPAISPPRCWPTPAPAPSSSAIPSAAPTITKPTREVRAKALAAWRAGLMAIVCVGEQRAEREAGKTLDVVGGQLDGSLPDGATGGQSGRRL